MCVNTPIHSSSVCLSVSLCVSLLSSGLRFQFSVPGFILASPLLHLKLVILTVRVLIVATQTLGRVRLFTAGWAVARQAPLSMRLSRQVYWSEVPFPPSADLPDPGIKPTFPTSPALAGGFFLSLAPPRKPLPEYIYLLFQSWNTQKLVSEFPSYTPRKQICQLEHNVCKLFCLPQSPSHFSSFYIIN